MLRANGKSYTMFIPCNNGSNYITSFEKSYPKRENWYLYLALSQAALNVVIFLQRVSLALVNLSALTLETASRRLT